MAQKTFVLVHGAWHGGWCWSAVAKILRGRGHTVFTPTQTGLGERRHLMSKSITLDTFVDDVANVLAFEQLRDVVLVGHSFAGSTISGVADRMPERVRRLFYLDANMLQNGQSPFSLLPKDVVEQRTKLAEPSGGVSVPPPPATAFGVTDPAQQKMLEERLTPHPFSTFQSPLRLANPIGNGRPATYIICSDPIYGPLQAARDWVKANGKSHNMETVEIAAGHDAMVTAPQALADLIDR
ncbi:MAG: alpha/beta fold hydrolase [Xanthobacteraceae bacterium]